MKRCIECGRPYRGGLNASQLLELGLSELAEGELEIDHVRDLSRMRELVRRVSDRLDAAMEAKADKVAAAKLET
jgi:hypothetical protein